MHQYPRLLPLTDTCTLSTCSLVRDLSTPGSINAVTVSNLCMGLHVLVRTGAADQRGIVESSAADNPSNSRSCVHEIATRKAAHTICDMRGTPGRKVCPVLQFRAISVEYDISFFSAAHVIHDQ